MNSSLTGSNNSYDQWEETNAGSGHVYWGHPRVTLLCENVVELLNDTLRDLHFGAKQPFTQFMQDAKKSVSQPLQ